MRAPTVRWTPVARRARHSTTTWRCLSSCVPALGRAVAGVAQGRRRTRAPSSRFSPTDLDAGSELARRDRGSRRRRRRARAPEPELEVLADLGAGASSRAELEVLADLGRPPYTVNLEVLADLDAGGELARRARGPRRPGTSAVYGQLGRDPPATRGTAFTAIADPRTPRLVGRSSSLRDLRERGHAKLCEHIRFGGLPPRVRARSPPQCGAAYPRAVTLDVRASSAGGFGAHQLRHKRTTRVRAAGTRRLQTCLSTGNTSEIQCSENPERLATDHEPERCFLHDRMIARRSWRSYFPAFTDAHALARHASMILSDGGSDHAATSPANPLVTRSSPS